MSYEDNNLFLSLPAGLLNTGTGMMIEDENLMPLTTQNYSERYKELERILADEKKTNEEFKKFYKVLKTDHTRVKTECFDLRSQMQHLIEENKMMQEKYKSMFEKMQQELRRKQLYIEELKNREMDDVKLERIKEDLSEQIEAPYKEIVRQLENELQKLQHEVTKLRYEANFHKSAVEHEQSEHHTFIDQLKLKHDIELNAIRKERDMLRLKLQENNQSEISKIKDVIRENSQLKIKVKSLMEENDELREKIEHLEMHNNSLVRNHSKLVSEFTSKVSVLEADKESLKQQADSSYKEMININESLATNIRKVHDLERENTKLMLQMDETQHNCKRDVANLKLESVKEKGEHTRARDGLVNQIEDLKLKVEIAQGNVNAQERMLEEKERELAKSMNSINEENWGKITELTNDKIELESKLQLALKEFEFKMSALQVEKDKSDDTLKAFEKQREEVMRENAKLRGLINESENLRAELEREQEKSRELYRKCNKLETELSSNTSLEQELTELNMKLKNELSYASGEIKRFKDQLNRLRDEYESKLGEVKSQNVAEKSDLQFKYENISSKFNNVKKFHDKKKKQYQAYARAIKQKAEALNAKVKELKMKEQTMRQMVPIQEYNKLKMHLSVLNRKHQTFRNMIVNSSGNFDSSQLQLLQMQLQQPLPFNLSINNDLYFEPNSNLIMSEPNLAVDNYNHSNEDLLKSLSPMKNEMHLKFDEITNRLDHLASVQNQHLSHKKTSPHSGAYKTPEKSRSVESAREGTSGRRRSSPPPKQIEIRKLNFSESSSESSIAEKIKTSSIQTPSPAKRKIEKSSGRKAAPEADSHSVSSNYDDDFI